MSGVLVAFAWTKKLLGLSGLATCASSHFYFRVIRFSFKSKFNSIRKMAP
jgi:hypothetical protein